MASPDQYSANNLKNSLAVYVANLFLSKGYLIYWHTTDALQIANSSTGFQFQFSQNKAAILANSTVAAAVTAAKGILTVVAALPAEPRFVTRLISDDSLGPADEVPVPALTMDLSSALYTRPYEIGSKVKWRPRHLVVDTYARDAVEQDRFADWLALWFQEDEMVTVIDHDAGTLGSVGDVRFTQPRVDSAVYPSGAEALTYEVLANVLIEYVA